MKDQLMAADRMIETQLRLTALVGSPRSRLAELARWLEHRRCTEFAAFMDWMKPERSDA